MDTQHIPNSLSSFFLRRGGDMGIGIQGEACREVAQHTADGLDIYAVLECDSCEGVAEIMESDRGDASSL